MVHCVYTACEVAKRILAGHMRVLARLAKGGGLGLRADAACVEWTSFAPFENNGY